MHGVDPNGTSPFSELEKQKYKTLKLKKDFNAEKRKKKGFPTLLLYAMAVFPLQGAFIFKMNFYFQNELSSSKNWD